jgi:hypothetical protein
LLQANASTPTSVLPESNVKSSSSDVPGSLPVANVSDPGDEQSTGMVSVAGTSTGIGTEAVDADRSISILNPDEMSETVIEMEQGEQTSAVLFSSTPVSGHASLGPQLLGEEVAIQIRRSEVW